MSFTANQWKDIPGFEGKYQVTPEGLIRRVYKKKTKLLTPYLKKSARCPYLQVHLVDPYGKTREMKMSKVIIETFRGPCPDGYCVYHKNGIYSDNHIMNLEYIPRKNLGKRTGADSRSKSVVKIDMRGKIVDYYSSARRAGRANYLSYQTVIDRCNGKVKKSIAPDGFDYAWEDDSISIKEAKARIRKYRR